jgi:hypothetical protein
VFSVSICESNGQQDELEHLRNTFRKNGYPDKVLDPILKKNKKQKPPDSDIQDEDKDASQDEEQHKQIHVYPT